MICEEAFEEFKSYIGEKIVSVESSNWAEYLVTFESGRRLKIEWGDGGLFINEK